MGNDGKGMTERCDGVRVMEDEHREPLCRLQLDGRIQSVPGWGYLWGNADGHDGRCSGDSG